MLSHELITKLYSLHETEDSLYLKLEYVDGISLQQQIVLNPEEITEVKARKIMHHILVAVNYMHSKSIKHNDLKPDNIIVSTHGKIKIIDFGMS
jgi:serine/threonine protein kinase